MFCPLAAIINLTVVIDVYLTADDEDNNVLLRKILYELTYFILSTLHFT